MSWQQYYCPWRVRTGSNSDHFDIEGKVASNPRIDQRWLYVSEGSRRKCQLARLVTRIALWNENEEDKNENCLCALLLALTLLGARWFEVASIKPASLDEAGISGEDVRNGLPKMWNVSLKRCIRYAYKIPEAF
jgi:hypothetical protein